MIKISQVKHWTVSEGIGHILMSSNYTACGTWTTGAYPVRKTKPKRICRKCRNQLVNIKPMPCDVGVTIDQPKKKREEYDKVLDELDKKLEPRIKAFRDSERITEEDLKIVINAKP